MKVLEAPPTFDRELAWELMRLADDSEREIRDYLHIGRLFLLQEEKKTLPIGQLLTLQSHHPYAEIKSLSISVERQGQGLGSLLVKEVLSTLKQEGTLCVTVATSTADIENIGFYQKLGFRCLKIERDAFTAAKGYPGRIQSKGILVRDKIWFDLHL